MLLKRHSEKLNVFRICIDMLAILCAWIIAFTLRFDANLIQLSHGQETLLNYLPPVPLLLISYLFVFLSSGVYQQTLTKPKIWSENFILAQKHVIAFGLFVSLAYFMFDNRYSRITLILFFILTPIWLSLGRSLVRKINRLYLKRAKEKKRALIVGSGPQVEKISAAIRNHSELNLDLVSVYSFADMTAVQKHLQHNTIDVIFVIPCASETLQVNELYHSLQTSLAEVVLFPYLGEKTIFDPRFIRIEHNTGIALNASGLNQYGRTLKRLFDVTFSFLFILIFSPVFALCAVLVRCSSPGPIFYKQERMGLDGKKFMCLKFRGMYIDAEKAGPQWAQANDSRTTPIGKWLRKTSLDEIPQFFNVLKGDMSIVGPRPERPVFVESFKTQIPGYMLRHKAKAGITGWAQINGWRGNTSLEKRIECDLWYIQNWSVWLDLKIVILTPFKGLLHPNAY